MNISDQGILIVLSGPSGAGKGTVVNEILARSDNYTLSISNTTRAPRPGEIDGVHYNFVTKDEFVEITNNYLSTKEWVLPSEKACFYTYGVNYSAYIIEDVYLFSLNACVNTDGSVEYDFYLSHYVDGVVSESETDPSLFEKFIK